MNNVDYGLVFGGIFDSKSETWYPAVSLFHVHDSVELRSPNEDDGGKNSDDDSSTASSSKPGGFGGLFGLRNSSSGISSKE